MVDQKPVENVEYFNCLGNVITNNAKFTWKIKSKIAMAIAASARKLILPKNWTWI
jgi:hypothetical protein